MSANWVLVRGLIRSRFHWGSFPERLGANVRTVELPGNGYLWAEQSPASADEAVEALRKQVSFENFNLVGISLGGMLAVRWAQLYPREVQRLALINSSSTLSPFYRRLRPGNYFAILKNLFLKDPAMREEFILSATSNRPEVWQRVLAEYTKFQSDYPVQTPNFIRQLRLTSQVDFARVPEMPKLVLASTSDRFVSSACSRAIAKAWSCPLELHSSAGHDLPLDAPEWVAGHLLKSC